MTLTRVLGKGPTAEKKAEILNRVASILLQGVARHAFQYSKPGFARFESAIKTIRAEFDGNLDEDEPLQLAASAVRVMEEHSDATARHMRARQNETEAFVATLTETLFDIAKAPPQLMMRFKEVERDFALASSAEEIAAVKGRLSKHLAELCNLAPANQAKAQPVYGMTDLLTGLPDAGSARAAIEAVWNDREKRYLAMVVLDRLEAINVRFGYKAGDEMLVAVKQHLTRSAGSGDQWFRWRGPCLVALMQRDGSETEVGEELSALTSGRIEQRVKIKDRQLTVPVLTCCAAFDLNGVPSVDDLICQLNDFASTRSRSDA